MKHNRKEGVLYGLFKRNYKFLYLVEFIDWCRLTLCKPNLALCAKLENLSANVFLVFQVSN